MEDSLAPLKDQLKVLDQTKEEKLKKLDNNIKNPKLLLNGLRSSYQDFKKACAKHIEDAKPILNTHRGWSELLINILLALTIVGFLAKTVYNLTQNKSAFFVHQTKAGELLNNIEKTVSLN